MSGEELVFDVGLLRQIFRAFPHSAVCVFDRDGRYVMAEGDAFTHAGLEPMAVMGTLAGELSGADWFLPMILECVRTGEVTEVGSVFGRRKYQVIVRPVWQAGELVGAIAISLEVREIEEGSGAFFHFTGHKRP